MEDIALFEIIALNSAPVPDPLESITSKVGTE